MWNPAGVVPYVIVPRVEAWRLVEVRQNEQFCLKFLRCAKKKRRPELWLINISCRLRFPQLLPKQIVKHVTYRLSIRLIE
jgi:hypothetical protein